MTNTMYTIAILLLMPGMMIILAAIVAIPLTLIQLWDEWDERRRRRKELQREYDYWRDKALSYDDFGLAAEYKTKAVACMAVLKEELKGLERGDKDE